MRTKKAIMITETNVALRLPDDTTKSSNLPAVIKNQLLIPEVEDLFGRENIIDEDGRGSAFVGQIEELRYRGALPMIKWMGITSADIADAPIGFFDIQAEKHAIQMMEEQTVAAYYKVIRDKLPAFWREHAPAAHKWFRDWMDKHHEDVVDDVRWGRVKAEIHVHKKPIIDPATGLQKMVKKNTWSNEMIPEFDETDIDIGKIQPGRIPHLHAYQWFSTHTLIDKRAPASVSIRCKTPEEVAHLCHCKVEDLPMAIQMMNYASAFCSRHATINCDAHLLYNKSAFKAEFPNDI